MSVLTVLLLLIPFVVLSILVTWIFFIKYPATWKKNIWLYIYGVAVLAYAVVPSYENDLDRYFRIIESLKDLSFGEAMFRMADGLVVENFVFWIIAKTNTMHLLPAITTSIVYGVACYITCDSAERIGYKANLWYVLLFQALCLPFFSIVNNVRNVTAFCIVVMAVYREKVQKKLNPLTIAMYIIPCFMHKTGVVLVVVRLMMFLFKKAIRLSLVIVFALPVIINFAYNNISVVTIGGSVGTIIKTLVNSAYRYMFNDQTEYARRFQENRFTTIRITEVLIVVLLGMLAYKYLVKCKKEFNDFAVFEILIVVLTISTTVIATPAYWRFSIAALAGSGPFLIAAISGKYAQYKMGKVQFCFLGLLAVFRFALNVRYTWTRMDFGEYALSLLTTNGYTIIMDLVRNMKL